MTNNFWKNRKTLAVFMILSSMILGIIFMLPKAQALPTNWTQNDWGGGENAEIIILNPAGGNLGNTYNSASNYINTTIPGNITISNVFNNPDFEENVTNWNPGAELILQHETTTTYNSSNGAMRVYQFEGVEIQNVEVYQEINLPEEAGDYIISVYAYTGDSINAGVMNLYFNGQPVSTLYMSTEDPNPNAWHKLTAGPITYDPADPTNQNKFGIYINKLNNHQTIYLDNFELYPVNNHLNSNVFDTGKPRIWGNMYFTENPNIKITAKSGNSPDDFIANDFSTCNTINHGESLTNTNCVKSGDKFIQYQTQLTATFQDDPNFPVLSSVNIMGPESLITVTPSEPYEIAENVGDITIDFALITQIDYDLTINFNISGTATLNEDFTLSANPLTIPFGDLSAALTITIINDGLYEDDETITITIEEPEYASLFGQNEFTYTIINTQDPPMVSIHPVGNSSYNESAADTISFDINLSGISGKDVIVPLILSGSATLGVDYTISEEVITISAGGSTNSFSITIINDEIFETNETIEIELSPELIGATLSDGISHTVTILNDDPMPEVNFRDPNSTFTEGDGEVFIPVDIDRPSYEDINLQFYFVMPETDIPQDFTINANCNEMSECDLLIPAGETTAYISLNITDNNIAEEPKDTTIPLMLGEPAPQATLGAINEHIFTINDDDVPGVTASTISNDTTEGGISGTFTVTLNTQPNADIEVTVASQDESEGTVDQASLTFTLENWDVPQTVTVTGVDDFIVDGDQPYWIQLNTFPSDPILDPGYVGLMIMPINVSNLDDDEIAIHVSPTSISTYEYNSPHEYPFTIFLGSQPDGTVIIDLMSEDESEGIISDNQIIFNDSNWNIPQEITLTSLDDIDQDGDITYSIVITINPGSTDSTGYLGASPDNIIVTNMDNDTPGITVSTISGNTTEAGGTATFTVVLDSQPTDDVTISLSSDNENEGTVNPSSLTFTNANWNNPQTVTITGVNDNIDDGDIIYNIIINSSSDDLNYHDFPIANVTVTNEDDDTAGITVSLISGDTNEDGGTAIFSIQLDSEPLNDVTIDISSDDPTEGSVNPTSITITPETWSTPRGITVTGLDDNIVDGNINYNIILAPAVSLDLNYDGLNPTDVSVSNVDNDSIGFTVTQSGGSTNVTEGGVTDTYTIKLNTIPSDDVIITINTNAQINAAPTTLTFTTANWNIAQTVTVTAFDDTVVEGNHTGSISHSVASTDPDYNEFSISNITVAITDNDSAPSTGGGGGFWFPSHNPSETPVTPSQTPADPQRDQRLEKLRSMGVAVHGLVKIADDGNPNTTFDNIVYYVGSDGKRHVFPNADIYKTWYDSFRYVRVYPLETLSQIPLGDNVRYKPGVKMIKFTSNNRVYAVEAGGKLRWIHNEKVAWYMYGKGWQKQIVNIPDALFPSYEFADDISHSNQFDFVNEANKSQNISMDLGL